VRLYIFLFLFFMPIVQSQSIVAAYYMVLKYDSQGNAIIDPARLMNMVEMSTMSLLKPKIYRVVHCGVELERVDVDVSSSITEEEALNLKIQYENMNNKLLQFLIETSEDMGGQVFMVLDRDGIFLNTSMYLAFNTLSYKNPKFGDIILSQCGKY
jgi:hypothetical protein